MPEITMQTILTDIGTFFTQSVDWMGDVLNVIVTNPTLLVMVVAMPVVGFSVGLLSRLIRL